MDFSKILMVIGILCVVGSIFWLLIEKQNIPYVRTQFSPDVEDRVVYATLLGVGGVVVIALSTISVAFS